MYRTAQYEGAAVEYTRAIREAVGRGRFGRTHLAQAYLGRGSALEQLGKHELAVADYGEAASLAFWDPAPYLSRAAVYCKLRQYDKAVADYSQVIRLRPKAGRVYCQRALAYKGLGKTDLAVQDAQMASCLLAGDELSCRVHAAVRAEDELKTPAQAPEKSPLYAAGVAPAGAAVADAWKFSVMPYVWVPDVEGNATVSGINTPANWGSRETFRNLDFTSAARIEAWKNRWGFIFDALYVKTGGSNNHPAQGIRSVNITAELLTLDFAVAYQLLNVYVGSGEDDAAGTKYPRLVFEPLGGVRYVYLNQEVEINPNIARVQDSDSWIEPFVGGRVALDLTEWISLQVRGDIGGFGVAEASDKTWSLIPGVTVRFSDRISMLAAYRITAIDYRRDSGTNTFGNDTTLKGPLVGVSFDF